MAMTCLMVGVAESRLIETVTEVQTVTRYNEETGEPYQKQIETKKTLFCGRIMTDDELGDLWTFFDKMGLERVWAGDYCRKNHVIGLRVRSVCREEPLHEIRDAVLDSVHLLVQTKMQQFGYMGDYKLFLVLSD